MAWWWQWRLVACVHAPFSIFFYLCWPGGGCVCIFVHRIGVAATGAATAVSRAGITRCTSTRRPSLWSHRLCTSKTQITNQIGAAPEFEMCFAPSTLMPGPWPTKTRLKSSIKKFIPHFIYDWLSLYGMPKRWTTRETSKHTHVNPYPLPPCRTAERGWCITIHHHPERGCRIFVRHHQHRNTHDPSPFHGVRISSSDHQNHRIPRRTADTGHNQRLPIWIHCVPLVTLS